MNGGWFENTFYICFPTFFQLPDKCHDICVAFLEIIFIEWLKELLLHKESVKMDKYYDITACSEPCTIRIADQVVMHEAWSITKERAVTRLNLCNTLLANWADTRTQGLPYHFKIIHDKVPSFPNEFVKPYVSGHRGLRFSKQWLPHEKKKYSKHQYRQRHFQVPATNVWNNLP